MQKQFGTLNSTTLGKQMAQSMRVGNQSFSELLQASGAFRVESLRGVSAVESFTTAIKKQDLSFSSLIKQRKLLNEVVREQQRLQRATIMSGSEDARGRVTADMAIPRNVPERVTSLGQSLAAAKAGQISFGQAIADGKTKLSVYSDALKSASVNTVNWGKNMQWAGRQLSMGLSLPFLALGVAAGKAASDIDSQLTRITKVYTFTNDQMSSSTNMQVASDKVRADSMNTAAYAAANYGTKVEDTLDILGQLAATGKTGNELQERANVITRAATLGELDKQKATQAAITLTNVYGLSVGELNDAFNYMNQLENQTSLSMEDMVETIPKVAAVVKGLGGDYKDVGTLAAAANAGGIGAAEAANSLKTILFRVNGMEGKPGEKSFIAATNVHLADLRKQAGGNLIKNMELIGKAIDKIADPHMKTTVYRDLFGVFQGSKGGTIVDQLAKIGDATSAAGAAAEVAAAGVNVWAATANQELQAIQNSLSNRFTRAIQKARVELAKMGEPFAEAGITIVNVLSKIISGFNNLPSVVKKGLGWTGVILAAVGPLTMIVGLMANLGGTIMKTFAGMGSLIGRTKILSVEERAQQLITEQGAAAFNNQADAAVVMSSVISELTKQMRLFNAQSNNITGMKLKPVTTNFTNMAADPYMNARVKGQQAYNAGLLTEQQLNNRIMGQERIRNSGYLSLKNQLHNDYVTGLITEEAYNKQLAVLETDFNALLAERVRLEDMVTAKKLTQIDADAELVAMEARLTATRERAAAVPNNKTMPGGGVATGLAMAGMMAGSIGILDSGTSKWVMGLSTGLFVMSSIYAVAKGIVTAIKLQQAAQLKAGVSAGLLGTAWKSVLSSIRAAVVSSYRFAMTPLGAVATALAVAAGGFLLIHRNVSKLDESWKQWSGSVDNTAKQLGVTLADSFRTATGTIDTTRQSTSKALAEATKWRKENERSADLIKNGSQKEASQEVTRIGVDVYAATRSAEKAKQAMQLAMNGADRHGLDIPVTFDESHISEQLKRTTINMTNTLVAATRTASERFDIFSKGAWTGNIFASKDETLGKEAKNRIKALMEEIGKSYDSGNLNDYTAQTEGLNEALNASGAAEGKLKNVRIEAVNQLVKSGLVVRDNAFASDDLTHYTNLLAQSMRDAAIAAQDKNKEMQQGLVPMQLTAELQEKLAATQQEIMKSSWGAVMGEAARQADAQLQKSMDNMDKASQARGDAIDAEAKKQNKAYDAQGKAIDARYKKEETDLKHTQSERKKAEDKVYDDRLAAIDKQMAKEQKAEDQRQAMFEAEKTRIQRLADMYNQNVDLNVALNSGNMDEAAKISNNMTSTTEQNAIDDAAAADAAASSGTMDSLSAYKDSVSKQKDNHDAYLDSLSQSEEDAMNARKDREKQALDDTKQAYADEVEARKKANSDKLASDKANAIEANRIMQEQLNADLAGLQNYIPKSEADMQAHINELQKRYNAHGIVIDTKSKEWANAVSAYIRSATATARNELSQDPEWAGLGNNVGDQIMKGMLGMSLEEFNSWIASGMQDVKPASYDYGAKGGLGQGQGGTKGLTLVQHGGGPAGTSSGRDGRSMSSGLYSDEIPTVLQKGEWVHDKDTVNHYGSDFMAALKDKRIPETGGGTPGLMPAAGGMAFGVTMGALRRMLPVIAKQKAAAQDARGQSAKVPTQIRSFLASSALDINGGTLTAGAAGEYAGANLSAAQLQNAATILSVGRNMGASNRDQIVAIMTALQESTLNNLKGGDRDSLGLFQQRPSQGWGTPAEIMNPTYAATQFYKHLLGIKNRDKMALTAEAQAVQRSAYPQAYAKWEPVARAIISGTGGGAISAGSVKGRGGRGVNSIADIVGLINGKGVPYRVTSTMRPGSLTHSKGTLSYHATGNAVDFGGVPAGRDSTSLLAINKFFAKYAKGLKELIYAGPGGQSYWNGSPHTYDATTRADHHDHVHVAATKDSLLSLPSMRTGGYVLSDNTIANLHKSETVLTAPLSEGLERGIKNMDNAGNNQYTITMDMRGSTIDSNFDIDGALEQAINRRESRIGRTRKIT